MKLVFATRNLGKREELRALLLSSVETRDIEVVGLEDVGIFEEVVEDGATLEANARKKAESAHRLSGLPCLADDSGLEVDALAGAPGVDSAIYGGLPSGAPGGDAANRARLIRELSGVPLPRTARFRCVLCLCHSDGAHFQHGTLEGEILDEERGSGGFGYDPLCYIPALGRTLAELDLDEKNRISHRGQALRKMSGRIASLLKPPRQ